MPQWDFLNFLAEHAQAYPTFHLLMQTEATDLIEDGGRVDGHARRQRRTAPLEIRADLVVGADGRHSTVREQAGLGSDRHRRADGRAVDAPVAPAGRPAQIRSAASTAARMFVMLDRGDYWQCAYRDPQGGFERVRRRAWRRFASEVAASRRFCATGSTN